MTKERYEMMCPQNGKDYADEGESEFCQFIIDMLGEKEQECAKASNRYRELAAEHFRYDRTELAEEARKLSDDKYWDAMALQHAMLYVEDWKNSI